MEIRILRSFLAVAREQSISGAARALHISQPSLSRQIMELEEEVGATLFLRGNRKITLTDQGMLLRKRAEQIVDLVRKTEDEMAATEDTVSGTIRIGAGETHAFRTVAETVHALSERYPEIRFDLFSGNAEDVMERLDKGLVDFGRLAYFKNDDAYPFFIHIAAASCRVWGYQMVVKNFKTYYADFWLAGKNILFVDYCKYSGAGIWFCCYD